MAADVRRRLPIPGGVWEAERQAQRKPGAARRGEDSGGDGGGGGAVARRSRLLKGTQSPSPRRPNTSPSVARLAGDPRAGGSGAQGCGRRAGAAAAGWGRGRGRVAAEGGARASSPCSQRGELLERGTLAGTAGAKFGTNTGSGLYFPPGPLFNFQFEVFRY